LPTVCDSAATNSFQIASANYESKSVSGIRGRALQTGKSCKVKTLDRLNPSLAIAVGFLNVQDQMAIKILW
jgi:uncharacterized membrane protein